MALRTVEYTAAEPTGVPALLELGHCLYGDTDPAAADPSAPDTPVLQVRRTAGAGTALDSEFELVLRLPGAANAPLDLARVGDDLAVTAGGTRRMVTLPSVLRRCTVTAARLEDDDLCVVFRPTRHCGWAPTRDLDRSDDCTGHPGTDRGAPRPRAVRARPAGTAARPAPVRHREARPPPSPAPSARCAR